MDNQIILLSDIAEIRQGYQFRRKVESSRSGSIWVIQMANIIDNKIIDYDNLPLVSNNGIKEEHLLKKNDIIFCSRGTNNYSILINEDMPNIIAVSQFHVLRINNDRALPDFIAWYLGQTVAIAYFKSNALTGVVPLITKRAIENLKIPLPPLSKQKIIAEIYKLKQREDELVHLIMDKKNVAINSFLLKSIEE